MGWVNNEGVKKIGMLVLFHQLTVLSHRGEFNICMCTNKIESFYDWIFKIKTFAYGRFLLDGRVILSQKRNTQINGGGAIVRFLI